VATFANRERYNVIIDVASAKMLRGIEEDCVGQGWLFAVETSVADDASNVSFYRVGT
jgi:hypothetical protein